MASDSKYHSRLEVPTSKPATYYWVCRMDGTRTYRGKCLESASEALVPGTVLGSGWTLEEAYANAEDRRRDAITHAFLFPGAVSLLQGKVGYSEGPLCERCRDQGQARPPTEDEVL